MEEKRKPIFEDVFELMGGAGCFQVGLYFLCCGIEVSVALSVVFYYFEYANPGWTCAPESNATGAMRYNFTAQGQHAWTGLENITAAFENETSLKDYCPADGSTRCENLKYASDFTSISTEWDFICNRRYLGRLTASLYFVGVLVGSCGSGYFSDSYGRRRTLLAMWVMLIVSQTISGFSPVWEMYLPVRILAGIMAGGCSTVAMILPMEYFGPRYRIITSNRIGWQIGGLLLALVGYLTRSWQYTAMANGLMMVPLVPLIAIFMPESARWSMQKGRIKEAKGWIKRIAKCNGKPQPDLTILDDIAEAERDKMRTTKNLTYLDLFRTKRYMLRTSALFLAWFDISLISYGIGADMEVLTGSMYLNTTIMSLCLLVLGWMTIPVANRIGRLKTYIIYKTGLISCMVVSMSLALVDEKQYAVYITAVVLFSYVWQSGVWALVFVFATEAFPTLLRTRASAVGNIASRVAGIVAPQIGLLTVYHASIPYIIYLTVGVVSTILVKLGIPETNNKPLMEDLPEKIKERDLESTGHRENERLDEQEEILNTTL
ncbi:solute carrier family 22 member 7-like [Lineus longissimus]|uniref:solute carrier family 22 member 7-like n=1 Tax=Lineus longissimus TaxID=88925 RepID=UPI00315D87EC